MHIDGFEFKKLPRLDKGNEAIRRATLTNDEYESLFRAMRSYCAKHNKIDDAERTHLFLDVKKTRYPNPKKSIQCL